ncbi:DinB family protein [Belliella pelovolcani]|uniref:Uncharacterized damage-inducible protein DinB (Forms a four-helix bundle) n=1 Tax=Belliella pelovolcani TaxID=529505 RepID=A0A1N7PP66_9BACT|nr:DinB family protein [Belliella pelovolcani]SIT12169.1 Uncharacterized damage-inducible protein DinB (forms a four-helix bundle) [Belliella pelovolcani]
MKKDQRITEKSSMHVNRLIGLLEDFWNGEKWIDDNLVKKVMHLSEYQVFKRPLEQLHSVAELVSHMLVWREAAIDRILEKPTALSVGTPLDWRKNDVLKEIGWNSLLQQFEANNLNLISLLKERDDTFLDTSYQEGSTFGNLIEGIVQHDFYHLGQIGITIKFLMLKSEAGDTC